MGYLARILQEKNLGMSFCTGIAVGQFVRVLKLPEEYQRHMIEIVVRYWFLGVKKSQRWQDDEEFCKGIRVGLTQDSTRSEEAGLNKKSPKNFTESATERPPNTVDEEAVLDKASSGTIPIIEANAITSEQLADIESNASSDATLIDNDDFFIDLPTAYEAELSDSYWRLIGNAKRKAQKALSGLPTAYEGEMFMAIEDSQ